MHMPAFGAGTMKRIAVFYQSTVMTNTQVLAVRSGEEVSIRCYQRGIAAMM